MREAKLQVENELRASEQCPWPALIGTTARRAIDAVAEDDQEALQKKDEEFHGTRERPGCAVRCESGNAGRGREAAAAKAAGGEGGRPDYGAAGLTA